MEAKDRNVEESWKGNNQQRVFIFNSHMTPTRDKISRDNKKYCRMLVVFSNERLIASM